MAGITTKYDVLQALSQITAKLGTNPILMEIKVKEMMPVVIIPMIIAKAILFFISYGFSFKLLAFSSLQLNQTINLNLDS